MVELKSHLDKMQELLLSGELDALEEWFRCDCEMVAGPGPTLAIGAVELATYQDQLTKSLQEAVDAAPGEAAKAVYFEYDLDNSWEGNFFLCQAYNPPEACDDDWATEWSVGVEGPIQIEMAHLYRSEFAETIEAAGINLYLIARTVAVFARARRSVETDLPICIAFHDQDPIMRT